MLLVFIKAVGPLAYINAAAISEFLSKMLVGALSSWSLK